MPSLFYSKTMSDFLDGIALGLSPQDLFSEEMEVESLTTQEGNVEPGSPSDQAPGNPPTDQRPSQAPEDQLLGVSQLLREHSDGSSSGGDENDNGTSTELRRRRSCRRMWSRPRTSPCHLHQPRMLDHTLHLSLPQHHHGRTSWTRRGGQGRFGESLQNQYKTKF